MRSVIVHAALALLGLALAYKTWTRPLVEEQRPSDEVVLLECQPDALQAIDLDVQTHHVHIVPERFTENGEKASAYWITVTRKKADKKDEPIKAPEAESKAASKPESGADAKAKADPSDKAASDAATSPASPASPATDAPVTPEKKPARVYDSDAPVTFRANAKLNDVLNLFWPMRALRGLGPIPKKDREQFGLDKATTQLSVECGGQRIALDVGGRTFGNQDAYMRNPKTDQSYLLPGKIITELTASQFKFTQNELHAFALTDIDEASISAEGKTRRLLHRDRLAKQAAQWVDASAPDRRNDLFGNFFDRVLRMRVRSYLAQAAAPGSDLQVPAGAPKPVVSIEYKLEGKPKGKLELVRVDAGEESFYYARSETTRRWVSLYDTVVKQVADDVSLVVSGEESSSEAVSSERAAPASQPPASQP